MNRWYRALLAASLAAGTTAAYAVTCTQTVSAPTDISAKVMTMAANSTLCLNPGTYSPPSPGFPNDGAFAIGNGVNVVGVGATPAAVVLQASTTSQAAVFFTNYNNTAQVASGASLQNLTIQGGAGGIQIQNFTNLPPGRLTDITLKDLVINTVPGANHGVLLLSADRINIDNVTVTSNADGFFLLDTTTSLIMNSKVVSARNAGGAGVAVVGGSGNVIVNNTFGSPKTGSTYPIPNGNVVFYNTTGNRFENNIVQGQKDDALDLTAQDGFTSAPAVPASQTNDNYIGKNTVIATGFADGLAGGSGIWSNCSSQRTWMYANDSHGNVECGLCIFTAQSNMALANSLHDNGLAALVLSGGAETGPFCTAGGGAFNIRPLHNFVQSNYGYFNKNDQFVIRDSDATEADRNLLSPRNGLGGALRSDCPNQFCESAVTIDSTTGTPPAGVRWAANINDNNIRGVQADTANITGVDFLFNKMIQTNALAFSRYNTPSSTTWDGGANAGGNYWTLFAGATGNPSVASPYGSAGGGNAALGVFDNLSNGTGLIVDRYPFKTEDMGRGGTVTVFEPYAGTSLAQGTRRTVRWVAPGCTYMDLLLDGTTTLASGAPNTGYAIVTIPGGASVGTHTIAANCRDSGGTLRGSGTSPTFSVSASTLQLMAPGRDDVFNASSQIIVAWKTSLASADIDLSTNGGSTWTSLGTGFTGTVARVTLPAVASTAQAMIRVKNGTTMDYTDGVFAIRGTSGATFTNVGAGRKLVAGSVERLEWASPQNSRMVNITSTVLGVSKNVAVNLPDRGYFDWVAPDQGIGTATLAITFLNSAGATISSASTTNASTQFPTLITFTHVSSLGIGSSSDLGPVTANSGLTVTLSSVTTGVCTVSGTVVTAVANGNCTITFTQAGNANYAPSNVQTVIAVQADPPRLGNISTRMQVLTGSNVMIGGFIIGGSTNKTVAITATGPSLAAFGISNFLANPTLTLVRSSDQSIVATNDDWQTDPNAAQLQAAGFAPGDPREPGLLVNLPPGAYTALVSGVGNTTGTAVVGVFEVDHPDVPLVNISTRGFVQTGSNVMIGGFIINGSGSQTVAITATGPSLAPFGISNFLANPAISVVRSSDQAVIASNDDWQTDPNAAALQTAGFAPGDPHEPGLLLTLPPGAYTVIVQGVGGGTGVAVVGVFTAP